MRTATILSYLGDPFSQPIKLGFLLIFGALSLSMASACSDGAQPNFTHTPTPYIGSTIGAQETDPQAVSLDTNNPGGSVPQLTSDNLFREIPQSQHDQLDKQISELAENIRILAECATEAGEIVPQPGSPSEVEWYARAAILHSACATSKATGVDFTGGGG